MKKTSQAVKQSRARAGLKSTSFVFTEEEKAEIAALADELGASKRDAILEAVRSFKSQGAISRERLIAEITRRLK